MAMIRRLIRWLFRRPRPKRIQPMASGKLFERCMRLNMTMAEHKRSALE